tara:strand:+ start:77 stop:208 length:132 start_codon:yes stop_codon:yes gene_type:complete
LINNNKELLSIAIIGNEEVIPVVRKSVIALSLSAVCNLVSTGV